MKLFNKNILHKIEFVWGPVKSGKSKKLIETYNRLTRDKKSCLLLSGTGKNIKSRSTSQVLYPTLYINNWTQWTEKYNNLIMDMDIIIIDEAQFFTHNTIKFIINRYHTTHDIYIFGLDRLYDDTFTSMTQAYYELMNAYNINAVRLFAKCHYCHKQAMLSGRVSSSFGDLLYNEKLSLETSHLKYVPLCNKCYIEKSFNGKIQKK